MEGGSDAHRHFEQLAVAHVLGGLDDTDARVFRSHLLECETCRARVGELRAIAHDLADVERDERRTRAAKAVETKKREVDVQQAPEPPATTTRTVRIALTVGLVLLIALTSWNFLLRQNLERRPFELAQLRRGATLLELGERAHLTAVAEEVNATVRFDADDIVVAADGLMTDRWYAIYLNDEAGNLLDPPRTVLAEEHTLLQLLPRVAGTATVTVTQPDPEAPAPTSADEGRPILQAVLPTASGTTTSGTTTSGTTTSSTEQPATGS